MPKGVPFAEGLSALEYEKLKKDRPYVMQLYGGIANINYKPLLDRLKQTSVPLTLEESYFVEQVKRNLMRENFMRNREFMHMMNMSSATSRAKYQKVINTNLSALQIPNGERGFIGDVPDKIIGGLAYESGTLKQEYPLHMYYPEEINRYKDTPNRKYAFAIPIDLQYRRKIKGDGHSSRNW